MASVANKALAVGRARGPRTSNVAPLPENGELLLLTPPLAPCVQATATDPSLVKLVTRYRGVEEGDRGNKIVHVIVAADEVAEPLGRVRRKVVHVVEGAVPLEHLREEASAWVRQLAAVVSARVHKRVTRRQLTANNQRLHPGQAARRKRLLCAALIPPV